MQEVYYRLFRYPQDRSHLNNLLLTTGIAAVVLYLSAGGLLIRQLALSASGRGDQGHSIRNLALLATLIGVIAHAVLLYGRVFTPEGLDMGFFNALSLAGWLICALLAALALKQPVEKLVRRLAINDGSSAWVAFRGKARPAGKGGSLAKGRNVAAGRHPSAQPHEFNDRVGLSAPADGVAPLDQGNHPGLRGAPGRERAQAHWNHHLSLDGVLGIAILPFAALALVLQLAAPEGASRPVAADGPIQAHIVLSILAYGALSIAALQAVLLAVQDRQLHAHRPGGLTRALPPLRTMESLLFQMIAIGFAMLSLALLSGVLFLEDIFAQHLVHKTVLSLTAWLVFAVLLWGRFQFGWRGRTAIRWTLSGFAVLLRAYFGSKFVLELVLMR